MRLEIGAVLGVIGFEILLRHGDDDDIAQSHDLGVVIEHLRVVADGQGDEVRPRACRISAVFIGRCVETEAVRHPFGDLRPLHRVLYVRREVAVEREQVIERRDLFELIFVQRDDVVAAVARKQRRKIGHGAGFVLGYDVYLVFQPLTVVVRIDKFTINLEIVSIVDDSIFNDDGIFRSARRELRSAAARHYSRNSRHYARGTCRNDFFAFHFFLLIYYF